MRRRGGGERGGGVGMCGFEVHLLTTALDFHSSTLCRMRSSPMGPRMAAYHLPIFSWWLSISVFT